MYVYMYSSRLLQYVFRWNTFLDIGFEVKKTNVQRVCDQIEKIEKISIKTNVILIMSETYRRLQTATL